MTRALFDQALEAVRRTHATIPALHDFVAWPEHIHWKNRAAHRVPASDLVASDPGKATAATRDLRDALVALAGHVEWRHTYTEAEVGAHFLANYGWFELAGPDGHFHTEQTRMTVGYWGPNLEYGWHEHRAEELYLIVSGAALFKSKGETDAVLGPGETRLHQSLQPHAMYTIDEPILTFVLWRGNGLSDPPRMSA